jgi:hypothetical protein
MDIETQLMNELAENGTELGRKLFLKWQEERIKTKERLIGKLKAVNNNCDLADVSGSLEAASRQYQKGFKQALKDIKTYGLEQVLASYNDC